MKKFLHAILTLTLVLPAAAQITYTPNLNLAQPPAGYVGWTTLINSNWLTIDTAVGQLQSGFQGAWSSSVTYSKGQTVSYSGGLYQSNVAGNINNVPSSSSQWLLMVPPATGVLIQTNGTNNTSQSGLNFANSSTVDFSNPSGGEEQASVLNSPAIDGITVTGTPSTGQALIATSASAADWQTIFTSPLNTEGDMLVQGPSGPERVAAGTSAYVWTSNGPGSIPSWQPAAGGGSGSCGPNSTDATSIECGTGNLPSLTGTDNYANAFGTNNVTGTLTNPSIVEAFGTDNFTDTADDVVYADWLGVVMGYNNETYSNDSGMVDIGLLNATGVSGAPCTISAQSGGGVLIGIQNFINCPSNTSSQSYDVIGIGKENVTGSSIDTPNNDQMKVVIGIGFEAATTGGDEYSTLTDVIGIGDEPSEGLSGASEIIGIGCCDIEGLRTGNNLNDVIGIGDYNTQISGASGTHDLVTVGDMGTVSNDVISDIVDLGDDNMDGIATSSYTEAVGSNSVCCGLFQYVFDGGDFNLSAVGNTGTVSHVITLGAFVLGNGYPITSLTDVIGIGDQTLSYLKTGSEIIAIGKNVGNGAVSTTGSGVWIGDGSGPSADGLSNTNAFGTGAVPTLSNQTVIGNTSITQALVNGALTDGLATAPSGSCTVVGWAFSNDGHATFCNGTTWTTKI